MKKNQRKKTKSVLIQEVILVSRRDFDERQAGELSKELDKFVILMNEEVDNFASLSLAELDNLLKRVKAEKKKNK